MNKNSETQKRFYQSIGKLFYSIADSDKVVSCVTSAKSELIQR